MACLTHVAEDDELNPDICPRGVCNLAVMGWSLMILGASKSRTVHVAHLIFLQLCFFSNPRDSHDHNIDR